MTQSNSLGTLSLSINLQGAAAGARGALRERLDAQRMPVTWLCDALDLVAELHQDEAGHEVALRLPAVREGGAGMVADWKAALAQARREGVEPRAVAVAQGDLSDGAELLARSGVGAVILDGAPVSATGWRTWFGRPRGEQSALPRTLRHGLGAMSPALRLPQGRAGWRTAEVQISEAAAAQKHLLLACDAARLAEQRGALDRLAGLLSYAGDLRDAGSLAVATVSAAAERLRATRRGAPATSILRSRAA